MYIVDQSKQRRHSVSNVDESDIGKGLVVDHKDIVQRAVFTENVTQNRGVWNAAESNTVCHENESGKDALFAFLEAVDQGIPTVAGEQR